MAQQQTVSEKTWTWRTGREERLCRGMTRFGHPAQITVGGRILRVCVYPNRGLSARFSALQRNRDAGTEARAQAPGATVLISGSGTQTTNLKRSFRFTQ